MRKLKLQVQVSIDGYMADADGRTNWMVWNWGRVWTWDSALREYHIALTTSVDCVLLSRKMAEEGFQQHWETMAEDPGDPQYAFASHIAGMRKVVFSETIGESPWKNAELARGDLAGAINRLKGEEGKDLIVYGGAAFASSLIAAGLIDEFYLFMNPATLGRGKALFTEESVGKLNLKLKCCNSFDCGVAVLHYGLKP